MYKILLKETDMIEENHFPAIALINEAFNTNPVEFVSNLAKCVGSGYNYASCSFWEELDDYDKLNTDKFDGIMINTEDGEETVMSIDVFIYYLNVAYERLESGTFQDQQAIKTAIDSLKTLC